MPLASGERLGRFEIVAPLGQGGMGEVYRARDTRLGREVAIKVLSPLLAADPDAVGRFEQEARAASALNHPGIVTVYDAGSERDQSYLVTELLEGSTLRQRLNDKPVPVREALDIGIQIAAALGAAHLAGIVHRDIKPENIFLTRSGQPKILDFGVARLGGDPVSPSDVTETGTAVGALIGTAGYMAPEQARGRAVDGRADVFTFGCVLYEMLSGVRAFRKETPVDTIAAIVTEDPSPIAPLRGVPFSIERILRRCLKKDPSERFQSALDLSFALRAARDDLTGSAPPSRRSGGALRWLSLAAVLGSLAFAGWVWARRQVSTPAPTLDAQVVVPASERPIAPALAPDGKWIAYVSVAEKEPRVFAQFLNGGDPVDLSRGSGIPVLNRTIVGGIDIAPDGNAIGFAARPRAEGLWSIPGVWAVPAPLGGPPRRVTDRLASIRWSPDGRQLAAVAADPILGDAVVIADADGQGARTVVPAGGGVHLHQVAWSSDSRYVYYARSLDANMASGDIDRVAVAGGAPERIVQTSGAAVFPAPTPDGRAVIYAGDRDGQGLNIWRHPLDGSPDVRLSVGAGEYTEPYLSRDGSALVCLVKRRKGELVRLDVDGTGPPEATAIGQPGSGDGEPSTAAGSDRIFITSVRRGRRQIWSIDATGGAARPITAGGWLDRQPVVSPDGRSVAFTSNRGGQRGIWIVAAEGGTPRLLVTAAVLDRVSWSADSRRVAYVLAGEQSPTLWIVDAAGGAPARIEGVSGRALAWSPTADMIVVARADNDRPALHFTSPTGARARDPLPITPVGLPTSVSWSPDGRRLALVNLPGRASAEVWVVTLADGALRKLTEFAAPAELDGVAWSADGRSVIVGRVDYETEVVLLKGLK